MVIKTPERRRLFMRFAAFSFENRQEKPETLDWAGSGIRPANLRRPRTKAV
jgi:hypothetical protein